MESFDDSQIVRFQKLQNRRLPQVELIRKCLDAGLTFFYGLIFDPANRTVESMRGELDVVYGTPEITMPTFVTLTIPLPGTPYFRDCLERDLFLPHAKLRDLDGSTLVLRPLDPVPVVTDFLRELLRMTGWRRRALGHAVGFYRRYHRLLNKYQMVSALARDMQLLLPSAMIASGRARRRDVAGRSFVTTNERLDPQYTPFMRVDARYESHFAPTMLTDGHGRIVDALFDDLAAGRRTTPAGAAAAVPS